MIGVTGEGNTTLLSIDHTAELIELRIKDAMMGKLQTMFTDFSTTFFQEIKRLEEQQNNKFEEFGKLIQANAATTDKYFFALCACSATALVFLGMPAVQDYFFKKRR